EPLHRVEDDRQLAGEAFNLGIGELDPGEVGDVNHGLAIDGHPSSLGRGRVYFRFVAAPLDSIFNVRPSGSRTAISRVPQWVSANGATTSAGLPGTASLSASRYSSMVGRRVVGTSATYTYGPPLAGRNNPDVPRSSSRVNPRTCQN